MRVPWRKSVSGGEDGAPKAADAAKEATAAEGFTARLRERGVTEAEAVDLARRLAPDLMRRQPSARAAYLDGVASTWHATRDTRAELDRSLTDIKEVERLMGAFTGELSKLDEVLEVLAAYVRRMRTSNGETSAGQTLH
jgi:hypothetical protein